MAKVANVVKVVDSSVSLIVNKSMLSQQLLGNSSSLFKRHVLFATKLWYMMNGDSFLYVSYKV